MSPPSPSTPTPPPAREPPGPGLATDRSLSVLSGWRPRPGVSSCPASGPSLIGLTSSPAINCLDLCDCYLIHPAMSSLVDGDSFLLEILSSIKLCSIHLSLILVFRFCLMVSSITGVFATCNIVLFIVGSNAGHIVGHCRSWRLSTALCPLPASCPVPLPSPSHVSRSP